MTRRILAPALLAMSLVPAACGSTDSGGATLRDGKYDSPGPCQYLPDPSGQAARSVKPPPAKPTTTSPTKVTIATNFGKIPATLTPATGKCAVNSFLSLAKQKFFDNTRCPRLTTLEDFELLQCGDPTGTGAGGPGYVYAEEVSPDLEYPAGTLAMANAGQPNTTGSQFFIVYGDTRLPPTYTVFGTVSEEGIETVRKIARNGLSKGKGPGDGAPAKPVEILRVT